MKAKKPIGTKKAPAKSATKAKKGDQMTLTAKEEAALDRAWESVVGGKKKISGKKKSK